MPKLYEVDESLEDHEDLDQVIADEDRDPDDEETLFDYDEELVPGLFDRR